jgi:hypothetical protein
MAAPADPAVPVPRAARDDVDALIEGALANLDASSAVAAVASGTPAAEPPVLDPARLADTLLGDTVPAGSALRDPGFGDALLGDGGLVPAPATETEALLPARGRRR